MFLEILQNSQESNCSRASFKIKLQAGGSLAQSLSCEFCKISRNTFFIEHLRATASVLSFFFLLTPFHCVVLNFEKKINPLLSLFLSKFSQLKVSSRKAKLFKKWNLRVFEIWLNRSKRSQNCGNRRQNFS